VIKGTNLLHRGDLGPNELTAWAGYISAPEKLSPQLLAWNMGTTMRIVEPADSASASGAVVISACRKLERCV
jgi:hypothetical protein